ncbi:MAG: BLUF domain-containing protein [Burkholderiaceae bacterium]
MLVRLLYASRTQEPITAEEAGDIVRDSREYNPAHGITGMLCYSDRMFMQLLEGGRRQVNSLYARILADPRHHDVILLDYEEITERRFADWTMGRVDLDKQNPSLLLKYSATARLDPYSMSGKVVLELLEELIHSAVAVPSP